MERLFRILGNMWKGMSAVAHKAKTGRVKGKTRRLKASYLPRRRSMEALGLAGRQFQPKTIERKRAEPDSEVQDMQANRPGRDDWKGR